MSTPDDLDAAISAAIRTQDKDTLGAAIRALDASEVFYRATVADTKDGQRVNTPLIRLGDGSHALVVYTSKSHPELPTKFGGAPWRHVLKMAAGLPLADWLIVSTAGGDWLPIDKSQMQVIIAGLEKIAHREVQGADASDGPGRSGLEQLISDAPDSQRDSWLPPLIESLRGRELFVRISPERSANGQPVMITCQVGDIQGLVQIYTSRSRSGMTYGGMTWEALVSMVENAPETSGLLIINDQDDWIILRRSEIGHDH